MRSRSTLAQAESGRQTRSPFNIVPPGKPGQVSALQRQLQLLETSPLSPYPWPRALRLLDQPCPLASLISPVLLLGAPSSSLAPGPLPPTPGPLPLLFPCLAWSHHSGLSLNVTSSWKPSPGLIMSYPITLFLSLGSPVRTWIECVQLSFVVFASLNCKPFDNRDLSGLSAV